MKNNQIKISIIIPTYNSELYIARCLQSVVNQSLKDIEVICIDDESTDNTCTIINNFVQQDSRVKLIKIQHGGVANARNYGLNVAVGKYVEFLDSDDFLENNTCEIAYKQAQEHNSDCVFFGINIVCDNKNKIPNWIYDVSNIRNAFYKKFTPDVLFVEKGTKPFVWNQIIKLSLLKQNNIKFNENFTLSEDQIFQFSYLPYAKNITLIENKLYNYFIDNTTSITKSFTNALENKINIHLKSLEAILTEFNKTNIIKKMRMPFMIWSINFLYGDIIQLEKSQAQKYSTRLYNFLIQIGYDWCYFALPLDTKEKIQTLEIKQGIKKPKTILGKFYIYIKIYGFILTFKKIINKIFN